MNFLGLGDYGLIGNTASAALVSRLGSIDWCCLPYLDSPSHFGALLDESQGGRFQIVPQGDFRSEQRYRSRTHVLETVFETPHGRAVLTDWMPVLSCGGREPQIQRKLEMVSGRIPWSMLCAPRFDYGAILPNVERFRDGILFRGPRSGELGRLSSTLPLELLSESRVAQARFTLEEGQSAQFSWAWGRRSGNPEFLSPDPTAEWWRDSAHRCSGDAGGCPFAGPWHDAVVRSGLVLKLLLTPYSGSLAESVTTSIPSVPGGSRTWDLRYSWLRDSAMTIQALANLGYRDEAQSYFGWLCDLLERDGPENLQPVYSLDGGREFPETELAHLAGYRRSRPVRIGNQSSRTLQLGNAGHILIAAAEVHENLGMLPARMPPRLWDLAEFVCQAWRRPDQGPWEARSRPEHFVASKVLCWAALDRAIRLARQLRHPVPPRWEHELQTLHRLICEQGFDEHQGSFVRSFSDRELDTATLVIPLTGFLPPDDPRVRGTLDALQDRLSEGPLMHRSRGSDGIPGRESVHLVSSFVFASCLALAGRVDEASDRLTELCSYASSLGLFAEQLDPRSHEIQGNFPSASAHVALVNAGLYIGHARGRQTLLKHLVGEPASVLARLRA